MAAKAKKAEPEFSFELKGRKLSINSDDMTFGEVEWIEDYLGCALAEANIASIKTQWAIAFIAYKRKVPDANFNELRECKLTALKPGEKRPTKPEPESSGTQSS